MKITITGFTTCVVLILFQKVRNHNNKRLRITTTTTSTRFKTDNNNKTTTLSTTMSDRTACFSMTICTQFLTLVSTFPTWALFILRLPVSQENLCCKTSSVHFISTADLFVSQPSQNEVKILCVVKAFYSRSFVDSCSGEFLFQQCLILLLN